MGRISARRLASRGEATLNRTAGLVVCDDWAWARPIRRWLGQRARSNPPRCGYADDG